MKIAMMGSGGVGGYLGAKLVQGGADVCFIARGKHLAAMRQVGLRVLGFETTLHLPNVNATDSPSQIGPCDIVALAVKLWDTQEAIETIRPLVGPETTLLSFQNGVTKDTCLQRTFPRAQVMGAVVYVSTTIDTPGVIKQFGSVERLILGQMHGEHSKHAEGLLAACKAGNIKVELSPDIETETWKKFVFLAGLSGTTSAMRAPIGQIRTNPRTRAFLLDAMREVVAVANAQGLNLPNDYAEQQLALVDSLAADTTSSMHHDLRRGAPLEVHWLSGAVVDLGLTVGVLTPVNRAIVDILALHA